MEDPSRVGWLRPSMAKLPTPRSPGVASDFPRSGDGTVRLLHLNESSQPASPKAIAAAQRAAAELNRYPDPMAGALTNEVARRTGIATSRIVFGSGSEDLIRVLSDISLEAGDEIVIPAPSFPFFAAAARLHDARPVRVPLAPDGSNDVPGLLAAIGPRTRLAFCCTPNPPNGAPTSAAAVADLARLLPDDIMLVLDEAYQEFAAHAGEPDLLPIMQARAGPWIVLRTFSKAYALAGLRVGYALCGSDAIADALRKGRLAYSPSHVAQAAALAAMQDQEHMRQSLDAIAAERQRLCDGLLAIGLKPYPSVTNFVSVKLPFAAVECVAALRARGILVRDWRDADYLNEIRITVGVPADTEAVLGALRDILEGKGKEELLF